MVLVLARDDIWSAGRDGLVTDRARVGQLGGRADAGLTERLAVGLREGIASDRLQAGGCERCGEARLRPRRVGGLTAHEARLAVLLSQGLHTFLACH